MTNDEVNIIWSELDRYRQGFITSGSLQRWMAEEANFNLPHDEAHFLNNCFEAGDRITEEQFFAKLVGPSEEEENDQNEENDNAENKEDNAEEKDAE